MANAAAVLVNTRIAEVKAGILESGWKKIDNGLATIRETDPNNPVLAVLEAEVNQLIETP